jgi:hypothetical protein
MDSNSPDRHEARKWAIGKERQDGVFALPDTTFGTPSLGEIFQYLSRALRAYKK